MAPEDWDIERVTLSEPLSRALGTAGIGGRVQEIVALDALAEQLRLNVDRLRDAAYTVLRALLEPLQDAMDAGPGEWLSDHESGRHVAVAEAAVRDLSLDEAVDALVQFGWQRDRLPANTEVAQVRDAVTSILSKRLSDRVYTALERWRKNNVWNEELKWQGRVRRQRPSAS